MGGAIGLTSTMNIGAEFWFTIPVRKYTSNDTQRVRVLALMIPGSKL